MESQYAVIHPRPEHFEPIQELCLRVYPFAKPWNIKQLESHLAYFPDGQLIVIDRSTKRLVGLAFSLIVSWDDYLNQDNWQDFTSGGYFHNHNPKKGKTLYGAEIMVDPEMRGKGIGKMLYEARKEIADKYKLKRIRAGARLRGYSKYQSKYTPEEYIKQVVSGGIFDPTLSFQLGHGFQVIDVAPNYLYNDPESLGYAAVIEWLNPNVATEADKSKQEERVSAFLSGERFVPMYLPRELRLLVRRSTILLGQVIKETEGEKFYSKVESYREKIKKAQYSKNKDVLSQILQQLKKESPESRLKIARAFSLQLELVNVCEAAYRTWRQRLKTPPHGGKKKLDLTFVLTAHPTESRDKDVVKTLYELQKILIDVVQVDISYKEPQLSSLMRLLWMQPLFKKQSPTVVDEADYIFTLVFEKDLFGFILTDKPNYNIKLRTWVGGDKDGHPYVDKTVMVACLNKSREKFIEAIDERLYAVVSDLNVLSAKSIIPKADYQGLIVLKGDIKKIRNVTIGDGTRVKTWIMKFTKLVALSPNVVKEHYQIKQLKKLVEMFPALVLPIELREDAAIITEAVTNKSLAIREMLRELRKVAGAMDITSYSRGMVVSHCESEKDLSDACRFVEIVAKSKKLPVIPLFETKQALTDSKRITKAWLSQPNNLEMVRRHWNNYFEVMLGYSDSSKEIGPLASRYLIYRSMHDIEKLAQSYGVEPVFFHGSGGSVARGGGSLKEQISWWSKAALHKPKFTVQGEMIQRQFATKEILDSQCLHLTTEAVRRSRTSAVKIESYAGLDAFIKKTQNAYEKFVNDIPLLSTFLDNSPYRYLDVLKIGSRPAKRPSKEISVKALRAIPWILCWTQMRLLLPSWWGIGSAWVDATDKEKDELRRIYNEVPFFASYVKTLGFTLAKVDLNIWEMYLSENVKPEIVTMVREEFQRARQFLFEVSGQTEPLWHRKWLQESISLRSPHIHILNLLQVLALKDSDEELLRATLVGIACGMLTTG